MPTQLTIPVRPQLGVGQFETLHAFQGLAGLRFAWGTTFGPLMTTLDAAFTPIAGGGLGMPPPPTGETINIWTPAGLQTLGNIGKGLTHTQPAIASQWVAQAHVFDGMSVAIERGAQEGLALKKHVARKTAPQRIREIIRTPVKVNLRPVQKRADDADARARAAQKEAAHLRQRVARLERTVAKPEPIPWPGIPGRIGDLERLGGWLKGELTRTRKLIGLGALAILVAKVLEKMGGNFIRCSNTKHLGRRVCGMDRSALDTLLAGTVLIVGTVSLVEFAKGMESVMDEIVPPVRKFWRVTT